MMPQIAGGFGITRIQESTNEACPATTLARRTFEDVGLPVLDVLNGWERLEEHIYWCVPVLSDSS